VAETPARDGVELRNAARKSFILRSDEAPIIAEPPNGPQHALAQRGRG
jgi:hypothetical protein